MGVLRFEPGDVVRGQYDGYRDEPGVHPESESETFAAIRLHIDSWQWSGVPWVVRTGKALPVPRRRSSSNSTRRRGSSSPATAPSRPTPTTFDSDSAQRRGDARDAGQAARALALQPGGTSSRSTANRPSASGTAYAGLLHDALAGDRARFAREDGVESAWRVVDPILHHTGPVSRSERGSWGPPEADRLLPGGRHEPEEAGHRQPRAEV